MGAVLLNRVQPKLGAGAFKSYSWQQPLRTHFARVPCAVAECDAYRNGWVTVVDLATDLGQMQYEFITHDKSRSWQMEKSGTALVSFTFGPGQEFFAGSPKHEHYRPVGRPPLLLVQGGDWRGNPRGTPTVVHRNAADWIDDFATHQERLARAQR